MSISLSIKLKNPKKFENKLQELDENKTNAIKTTLNKAGTLIWAQSRRNSPVDTGRLQNSIAKDFNRFNLEMRVGTNVKYAIFVHEGTKPHWPPIDALRPWARSHGISPFVVARAIARKGTKAQPFIKRAVDESENKINRIFESEIRKAIDKL